MEDKTLLFGALLVGALVIAVYFLIREFTGNGGLNDKYLEVVIGTTPYYLTSDQFGAISLTTTKASTWTYDTEAGTISVSNGPAATILSVIGDSTSSDLLSLGMLVPSQTSTFQSQWTLTTQKDKSVTVALKTGGKPISYYINTVTGAFLAGVPTATTPASDYVPIGFSLVN